MMLSFKQFLAESAINFDMTDLSKKEEGRGKLAKMAGIDLEAARPFFKKATASNVVSAFNAFVDEFPGAAATMNNAKPDGVGPGEVIFYFVFDNVGVGGKNSSIDLYLNNKPWAEAKAGPVSSGGTISNFKITKDGAKAVDQILKDFEAFNAKYEDITGEQLPGWRTAGTISTNSLRSWADIDLEHLGETSTDGPKKAIELKLQKDGDLVRKGDEEPIMNVKKSKSVAPVAKLIDGGGSVKLSAEEKKISTVEKIVARWVDNVFDEYLDGKLLALVDNRTKGTKLAFFGNLKKEQLGLYVTHRNQPWAEVFLNGTRQDGRSAPKKAEPAPKKGDKNLDPEALGKSLKK